MSKIEIEWTEAMEDAWCAIPSFEGAAGPMLEAMTPEAQRDLAAQLLRAASEREGFTEDEVKA